MPTYSLTIAFQLAAQTLADALRLAEATFATLPGVPSLRHDDADRPPSAPRPLLQPSDFHLDVRPFDGMPASILDRPDCLADEGRRHAKTPPSRSDPPPPPPRRPRGRAGGFLAARQTPARPPTHPPRRGAIRQPRHARQPRERGL